jgi:hypothetical protein
MVGSSKHGNEFLDSIRSEELLDQLSNYQFLKKDHAQWNW